MTCSRMKESPQQQQGRADKTMKALTPACYCDRGVVFVVRGEPRCTRHLFGVLPLTDRVVIAARRRARELALVVLVLVVVCACSGVIDGEAEGAAGTAGELAGAAGAGGQPSPVSMGDAGAGGQGGSSSSSVGPCCAVLDPSVMSAANYGCWCNLDQPAEFCSQAYWDFEYHATPEEPGPELVGGQCTTPEIPDGQVWCCVRYARDHRYPETKTGCRCDLYTPDVCQSMVDSLGQAAGGIRVDQCP